MFAVVGLPFVVAAAALRRPQWYPVLDLAMTELRLRDVGTTHTPLIGLPGRIGRSALEQGSHPGPLSFYLLAPLYRLFGSSSWAMQAATIVLNLVALGAALALAARRGGTRLVIAVAALLALVMSGYGLVALTQPWNPYLPLLWWLVFLLAVWSVACNDVAMLPLVVVAGSLCAQTHVPYLGLVLGVGSVAVVTTIHAWKRAGAGSRERRRAARWVLAAAGLGIALWIPPLIDQAIHDPGNLRRIYDHLATPPEDPIGVGRGVELALGHLDGIDLVTNLGDDGALLVAGSGADASLLPGLAVLAVWGIAVAVSLRHGSRSLVRLHVVAAVALVFGFVAMARIFGKEWYYLMLWAWGVTLLVLLAIGWTALEAIGARLTPARRTTLANGAAATLLVVAVVSSMALTIDAVDIDPPESPLSEALGRLMPDTVAALERGDGAATGPDGHYVVTWDDSLYFGSQGFGLVSELERAGLDAGAAEISRVPITEHRVIEPENVTAVVHLANGQALERWRQVPEAVEVAYVEPRNAAERAEFAELRSAVIDDLRADGLDDLVELVDGNLFGVSVDDRISDRAERWTARMLQLGKPTAVFITPPGVNL